MHRATRLLSIATLVCLGAGSYYVWRWEQRGPSRPSVGAAVNRFRTSTSAPDAPANWTPRPGVYLYAGHGTESLSFLGTKQGQGPTEPGTITSLPNGCWTLRMDFNSFHSQTWTRCSVGGALTERAGTTDQKFDFAAFSTTEHTDVTCVAPIPLAGLTRPAGTTSTFRCQQQSRTTKAVAQQDGTVTFLGRDTVLVEGQKVPALHTHEQVHLSGGQTGDVTIDLWFAVNNALPLAERHTIRVVSPAPAPLHHVTYTEEGSWQLRSLTPRT